MEADLEKSRWPASGSRALWLAGGLGAVNADSNCNALGGTSLLALKVAALGAA